MAIDYFAYLVMLVRRQDQIRRETQQCETRSLDGDRPWSVTAEKRADVSDGKGTSPVLGQRAGDREEPDRAVMTTANAMPTNKRDGNPAIQSVAGSEPAESHHPFPVTVRAVVRTGAE
jgi:hypothetical protein